jgi:integral membrane protein
MLNTFRTISILEGLSYLLILSVAVGMTSRDYVFQIGMIHGVLFMLYLIFSLLVCNKQRWSLMIWLPLFFASIVPFGFMPVEMFIRRATARRLSAQGI